MTPSLHIARADFPATKLRPESPGLPGGLGETSWGLLLAMLACGGLVYLLVRDAWPAGVAVMLGGLAANACGLAVMVAEAEQEAQS